MFQASKLSIVYCLLSIIFFSCKEEKFPDFSKTENELYYKIHRIGEGTQKVMPHDYVTAQILIKDENDSVLFDTRNIGLSGAVTFQISSAAELKEKNDYHEGYLHLSEGDSASFITDAYCFFIKTNRTLIPKGFNLKSIIRIETKVLKIFSPKEYEKELFAEQKRLEQGEFEEKRILEKYLADSKIAIPPIANGMYHIILAEGKGPVPDSGSIALLNYRGYFLNGRIFDSNYETQPFEYFVGAEEQLIKGLETGVRRMHEGERAKFIIPSYLAFGSSGSSAGIVPPFTTVIYEVELLKVQ